MLRPVTPVLVGAIIWSAACTEPAPDDAADSSAAASEARVATTAVDRCYRSRSSVLLGPPATYGQRREGPGWIRLSGVAGSDSGAAELVDADGSGLAGSWRRRADDSVVVAAFDDFLRVELRLRVGQAGASGRGNAHSDAALERDSSGRPAELRRGWTIVADGASCDSMPSRATTRSAPN